MDIYKKRFSEMLRKALHKSILQQNELAEKMNVKASSVSRWASGLDLPSDKNFKKLCSILQVRPDYFLGIEVKKEDTKNHNSLVGAAEILAQIASLSPLMREVVLAILYKDPSLLTDSDPELAQYVRLLSKVE
jgi:transcriptional regulator with XRE-family HTH domain